MTAEFDINDQQFMKEAILQAEQGAAAGDIPVGAIVVKDGEVIGKGYNRKFITGDPTDHAEMIAMKDAADHIGDWRLNGCTLYSTAEPCIMCSGAILHYRIDRVVFGVLEPKFGGVISHATLFDIPELNHRLTYTHGLFKEEIVTMMKTFFKQLREKKQQ